MATSVSKPSTASRRPVLRSIRWTTSAPPRLVTNASRPDSLTSIRLSNRWKASYSSERSPCTIRRGVACGPHLGVDGLRVDGRVRAAVAVEQDLARAVGAGPHGRLGAEAARRHRRRGEAGHVGAVDARHVLGADERLPAVRHHVGVLAEHVRDDVVEAVVAPHLVDELEDALLAVGLRDEAAERLALLVHRERARDAVEVVQRDERVGRDLVAQDHLVLVVRRAAPVLGEALGEPQRQGRLAGPAVVAEHAREPVEREHMGQLVADDPAEAAEVAVGRDHHAALEELEEAADAVGDKARRDVGALEVQVGRVEDDRDALDERHREAVLEARVRRLRLSGADARQRLRLGVVVDVEVLRAEHVPVEAVVLDLVAPERLGVRGRGAERERGGTQEGDDRHAPRDLSARASEEREHQSGRLRAKVIPGRCHTQGTSPRLPRRRRAEAPRGAQPARVRLRIWMVGQTRATSPRVTVAMASLIAPTSGNRSS